MKVGFRGWGLRVEDLGIGMHGTWVQRERIWGLRVEDVGVGVHGNRAEGCTKFLVEVLHSRCFRNVAMTMLLTRTVDNLLQYPSSDGLYHTSLSTQGMQDLSIRL